MAEIYDKKAVAAQLKEGVRAVADQLALNSTQVQGYLADQIGVEPRTIVSWINPSSVPGSIEDKRLLGLTWLAVKQGGKKLDWLSGLLKATSVLVVEPPSPAWVQQCFKSAQVYHPLAQAYGPPTEAELDQLLQTLFPTNTGAPVLPPDGVLELTSLYYIPRVSDKVALDTIQLSGVTITLKAPRKMGKSSLLVRCCQQARWQNKQVILMDFQLFDRASFSSADIFLRQFCIWLTRLLKLESQVEEFWSEPLVAIQRCTAYLEEYLLPELDGQPLLLALDEVDQVFDTPFRSDFFAMLRHWHNARHMKPVWQGLDLVLVTSTEPYQFVQDLNQSPFNVGVTIELEDFTPQQVAELNQLYGRPFAAAKEEQALTELLAGQPYLTHQAFYLVKSGRTTSQQLLANAAEERGPFGEHLRHCLQRLQLSPSLVAAMRQVLTTNTCPDDQLFWRLYGAGLVKRVGSGATRSVVTRYPLYTSYFKEKLL
jgi:hypothetical protein